MIKILTSSQIREADQYTINNEPINSLDLMERASLAFVGEFEKINSEKKPVKIFCGTGNNGGDGLAIGRLLKERGWEVYLYIVGNPRNGSNDFKANLDRSELYALISSGTDLPAIEKHHIVIDGLFGSGLSRPLEGFYAEVVNYLNQQECPRFSIDIASGLYADSPISVDSVVFKPDYTLSFQVPKLSFFLPDCYPYVGEFRILDIGLSRSFIEGLESTYSVIEDKDVKPLLPVRSRFAHKNRAGRLMIVAGSKGKMGAAVLCTMASFKVGVGLVNVCVPKCGTQILQISIPEAMVLEDKGTNVIQSIPISDDVIAIGPGLGTDEKTIAAFEKLLKKTPRPMVIDADGINILSQKKSLLNHLPKGSILTPHPGEFKRLVGNWENDFGRLEKLRSFCKKYLLNVVLKGAYSAICDSSGKIFFNSTGNPSMATAGSGDVLTGVIASFLAQGLAPVDALKLGVFIHGLAGDEAVKHSGAQWIQAMDIVSFLRKAGNMLRR